MKRRRFPDDLRGPVGWLFADLLLGLAMLFLIANTVAIPVLPKPKPTPTPTLVPTPTPTLNALLLDPVRYTIIMENVDYVGLLNTPPNDSAIADLEQKIKQQITNQGLQHRRAGIAIAYGVASNNSEEGTASSVAAEVYNVLDLLGQQQKFVFCHTLHYDPLFTLFQRPNCRGLDCVIIDIYLFSKSTGHC